MGTGNASVFYGKIEGVQSFIGGFLKWTQGLPLCCHPARKKTMKLFKNNIKQIGIRRAQGEDDLLKVQALRYQVFYEEFGAKPIGDMADLKRDYDEFDDLADHLVVTDTDPKSKVETIIGTYRLLKQDQAAKQGNFLTGKSYDLTPLLESGQSLLELSRSCVLPAYRTRPVLQLLWKGIAEYLIEYDIEVMLGCASFLTTDINEVKQELAYLHHHHLVPKAMRVRARDDLFENMDLVPNADINVRKSFHKLPPLIKGYLRVGSTVGEGAVIDHQFGTIDVFVSMQTHMIAGRYRKHYMDDKTIGKSDAAENVANLLTTDDIE